MGTYLATGIVKEIAIQKSKTKYSASEIKNIIYRLRAELNIDYYNYSEDTDGYYWKIKTEMLEGDLAGFLDTQFQMYNDKKDSHMQEAIEKITAAESGQKILELATSGKLINFQLVDQIEDYIRVKKDNGFNDDIAVFYELISYFQDGKIITKGLGNSLRYFEANIRLQKNRYPVVDCVKVMITSY